MLFAMGMKSDAVFAIFADRESALRAEFALQAEGFKAEKITFLLPRTRGDKAFSYDYRTFLGKGAAMGVAVGTIMGGFLGLLAGAHVVHLPLLSSHLNMVTGLILGGVFGAAFGAGSGALIGLGTPVRAIERYATYLDEGGITVMVHVDDSAARAKAMRVLDACGGNDVSSSNEGRLFGSAIKHGWRQPRPKPV